MNRQGILIFPENGKLYAGTVHEKRTTLQEFQKISSHDSPYLCKSVTSRTGCKELQKILSLDFPYPCKTIISEVGWIVGIIPHDPMTTNNRRLLSEKEIIKVAKYIRKDRIKYIRDINVKSTFSYDCLVIKNDILYLGGSKGVYGAIASMIDLNNLDAGIIHLELPANYTEGRNIDDILIIDNRLLLVDDVISPKYIIEYDSINDNSPKYRRTIELTIHGTNEEIIKAEGNEKWIILLSATSSRLYGGRHVSILKSSDYSYVGSLNLNLLYDEISWSNNRINFSDICLIDDKLLIALNAKYIAIVELDQLNIELEEKLISKKIRKRMQSTSIGILEVNNLPRVRRLIKTSDLEIIIASDYENSSIVNISEADLVTSIVIGLDFADT